MPNDEDFKNGDYVELTVRGYVERARSVPGQIFLREGKNEGKYIVSGLTSEDICSVRLLTPARAWTDGDLVYEPPIPSTREMAKHFYVRMNGKWYCSRLPKNGDAGRTDAWMDNAVSNCNYRVERYQHRDQVYEERGCGW